jgi:hypothetical protein
MLHALLALCHDLGAGVYTLLHLFASMLVHPACDPPAPCMARALRLERARATSRGRLVAHVTPTLDGVDTNAAPLTSWTAIRVRGRLIGAIVVAAEP